jgi:hypothetical protein
MAGIGDALQRSEIPPGVRQAIPVEDENADSWGRHQTTCLVCGVDLPRDSEADANPSSAWISTSIPFLAGRFPDLRDAPNDLSGHASNHDVAISELLGDDAAQGY